MQVHYGVMNCCGIVGLFDMPVTKQEFLLQMLSVILDPPNRGAFIQINTSSQQPEPNTYLPELGFTRIYDQYNPNSGNRVYLWVMDAPTFTKLWAETKLKAQKLKLPNASLQQSTAYFAPNTERPAVQPMGQSVITSHASHYGRNTDNDF